MRASLIGASLIACFCPCKLLHLFSLWAGPLSAATVADADPRRKDCKPLNRALSAGAGSQRQAAETLKKLWKLWSESPAYQLTPCGIPVAEANITCAPGERRPRRCPHAHRLLPP